MSFCCVNAPDARGKKLTSIPCCSARQLHTQWHVTRKNLTHTCCLLPVTLGLTSREQGTRVAGQSMVAHVSEGGDLALGLAAGPHCIPTDVHSSMHMLETNRTERLRDRVTPEHDSVADTHQPPEHAGSSQVHQRAAATMIGTCS